MTRLDPDKAAAYRERLLKLPTSAISDAQISLDAVMQGIGSLTPGAKAVGPAFTVKCYPGSIITVHKALLEARAGDVIVVDGGGDDTSALFGELMALQAQLLGIAGLVVNGVVRDKAGIQALNFPVFAKGATARVGTNRRLGNTGVTIACGGISVSPGDWIVADDDSVAVIPQEQLEDVIAKAEAVEARELDYEKRIRDGEHVADIVNLRQIIYAE